MQVGRCLNTHSTTPASRSKACSQRCCAFVSSTGHQQAPVAQAAARSSATSEVRQAGISAPVAGHLSGLYQLLEAPRAEVSVQAQLNDRLKRCTTWEELASLLEANLDIVDFVNISTAWTRLAKLFESTGPHRGDGRSVPGGPPVGEPAFRRFLERLIETTSQQLRLFGVRALANVMWALSNADWQLEQYEPAVDKLMHEWCASVHERLPELRAPDVSNISTAIGRLDHRWRPGFVVDFYRSVLHRTDLLEQLDLTTLNNVLYGLSRAGRRGLIHMGPAARRLLAQCVDQILERPDREAAGLVPWRAAQLLYNCHKFKLRVRSHLYGVLMPVVAEVYTCDPNPMDCWSFGFLTAFVAAHCRVHPVARPDLQPLYVYLERRLPEASTSQLAMLAHSFRELGCPPPAPFWGEVFSRYMPVPSAPSHAAASSSVAQQQHQLQPHRQRTPHAPQLLEQQQRPQQQHVSVDSVDGRTQSQEPQLHNQDGKTPRVQAQVVLAPHLPSGQQRQQQQQHSLLSRQQQAQLQLQVQCHQQQAAQALQQQQRAERGTCGESMVMHGHLLEPHRAPHMHTRAGPHSAQSQHAPQPARKVPHSTTQEQKQQHFRRPSPQLFLVKGPDWQPKQLQQQQEQHPPQQQQEQQQPSLPQWTLQPLQQPQQQESAGSSFHQASEQPQQLHPPHRHPHAQHARSPLHPHAYLHPRPHHPHPGTRPTQPDLALTVASLAGATPLRSAEVAAVAATSSSIPDDLAEPRTLHYVCWQAAKAGILPPRAFLRLYVERVPQWLVHSADDTQVAQAVETLKLLRWVPRRELREMLCATLKHRAATSRLPMRSLLWWVRKQR